MCIGYSLFLLYDQMSDVRLTNDKFPLILLNCVFLRVEEPAIPVILLYFEPNEVIGR
jgi:hypothetical protein